MASTDRELEQQLLEAGNKLAELPSSVDELLPLLDQVETFLARVEQSPPASMQDALAPSLNALVKDELLGHSDFDVKVAVASCISEITRITAPDAPYQDDKMKDVFQLIVSSFENLSDKSSRSFNKMASILETVAKVRSCVVMLDLECDGMIVEMFQHFLKSIRDYHPENVFTSMETIMSLVLEESEDISLELLTPILASVKRNNEEFLPIARKLGERVFENCASKLRPCMSEAVKSLGISLDDYSKVVASVCEGTSSAVEHNDDNAPGEQLADEGKLTKASSDEAAQADGSKITTASSYETAQVAKESVTEEACPEEVEPTADRSPKSVVSNGITETGNEETLVDPESLKEPDHDDGLANQSSNVSLTNKGDADDLDAGKSVKQKLKPEQTAKRKGKKTPSVNSVEPSDASHADSEKEAEKLPDRRKSRSKGVRTAPPDDLPVESNEPSENETDAGIQLSPPKALESEAVNATSPSPGGSIPDESRLKKGRRTKKKQLVIDDEKPSVEDESKKVSEAASDSELKPQRRSGKKATTTKNDKILAGVGTSKNEGETTNDLESKPLKQSGKKGESSESEAKPLKQSGKKGEVGDSEAKPLKQSGKKGDASNNIEDKSSLKKNDRKGRGRGKDTAEKGLTTSSAKDDVKEVVSSPKSTNKPSKDEGNFDETPKTDSKRKRTPGTGKDKASTITEHADNLVGLKVKVWWPEDQEFYEGVIESFDPSTKKHKVFYTDGDEELLFLKKERWELVEEDIGSHEEQAAEDPSPEASPEMQKKKKAKTNPEPSAKQEKTPLSPKRPGTASSSKTKGTASKSGRNNKSKDDGKVTSTSKPSGKSEDNTGGKSQDHSKKTGSKSFDDTLKSAMKFKDVDSGTTKSAAKSKQETPKTASKPKGKIAKSGGESNTNGSGKAKSSSSKGKETEDSKGKTAKAAKATESAKGKSTDTSKSGKKRKKRS